MPDRYRRDNSRSYYRRDYSNERRYESRDGDGYRTRDYRTGYTEDEYRRDYRREDMYDDYRPRGRTSGYSEEYYYRSREGYRRAAQMPQISNEGRGIGKKVIVIFIAFAFIIGNFILFSVLNDVSGKDKKDENIKASSSDKLNVETVESESDVLLKNAKNILSQMSTEEKVGQLLLIRSYGRDIEEFSNLISECKVGGVVLFKSDFENKTKQEVKDMTKSLQESGGGNLLICVDEEGGTVVRMSSLSELRSEKYKSPQDLYKIGGYEEIKSDAENKCRFLKDYGVNVNFGPVADVVTENSAFMYKRAFGKNAEATGEYVKNVVEAMKENKVGSSLKHFPGYGNSKGDTHEGLDHNTLSIGSLKASDLVPFQYGIEAGADSIMVTHTIIDEVDSKNPASLSKNCVNLIRDYLEFDGVIMTDALDMGAIIEFCDGKDPCVQAFKAGIDMLCLPSDPVKAYENLIDAVNKGEISQGRLDESVTRILMWKLNLGLHND